LGLKSQISELVDNQAIGLGKLRRCSSSFGKLLNDCGGCDELHGMPNQQDRFTQGAHSSRLQGASCRR